MIRLARFTVYGLLLALIGGLLYRIDFNRRIKSKVGSAQLARLVGKAEKVKAGLADRREEIQDILTTQSQLGKELS